MSKPMQIDVYVTHRDGALVFDEGHGVAPCSLWAEITPWDTERGDYQITGIWMSSLYDTASERLTGASEEQAKDLLELNDKWLDWAFDEAWNRMERAA